jgi:cytidyltransferase-like protein
VFSGGFDPIHSGHIELIKEARKLGRVILALNSDEWLRRKKGKEFLPFTERKTILDQFKDILCVIGFDDSDNSASDAIRQAREMFPNQKVIFANGGDRTAENIPEQIAFQDDPMVEFAFSIGGDDKKNSSSWILKNWKSPTEERIWGDSMTYHESPNAKVKRLIIKPGKGISMQYHLKRSEFWFIEEGHGEIIDIYLRHERHREIKKHQHYFVNTGDWHQIINTGKEDLCIIEIQYGEYCTEEDIIRL